MFIGKFVYVKDVFNKNILFLIIKRKFKILFFVFNFYSGRNDRQNNNDIR